MSPETRKNALKRGDIVLICGCLLAALVCCGLWLLLRGLRAPEGPEAVHCLLGAYFAHLLARAVCLTLRYRRDVLVRPFKMMEP